MAIEGGSGYRNNLIALAKLRANSKADPMAWTRVFVDDNKSGLEEQSKLLWRTINRMDKKGSLYTDDNTDAIDSYLNMLDRAYGIEEEDPNTKEKIFKPGIGSALEGLMSPVAGERKIDLSSARGLEGLRSNIPNERTGRPGAAKYEQRQGNDIIRTLGTRRWSKREEGSTPAWDLIKAAGPELKRDPQAVAQDMTLGILGSFSNIASDVTGADKNLLAEALKKRPELLALVSPLLVDGNVRGRTMALEQAGVLRPDASAMDVADAASWLVPGVGFAKPAQVAARTAKGAGKFALANIPVLGVGAGGLGGVPRGAARRAAARAEKTRNTEPYEAVLGPEEYNQARWGSSIGAPMEKSSYASGLATPEEYALMAPEEQVIEDSILSISRQVWGQRRGLNEPPSRYTVQDYPTLQDVSDVIIKSSNRYGDLTPEQIQKLYDDIVAYIDTTPGAKWRVGDKQGLDIHHMDPYASGGIGSPERLAPVGSSLNRFVGDVPLNIWYKKIKKDGLLPIWRDLAPNFIKSIEDSL